MDTNKIIYFFPKLKNRLREEKNRLWEYVDVGRFSMRDFKPFVDAASFKHRLQSMLGVFDESILDGFNEEDKSVIINSAEQALQHEFDLLGSGPIVLDPIDWHTDFKSGTKWEKQWYREIIYYKGADIKVPWELSRCQHLLWLGEAYLLTKEEKYAQEVIDEINWWIDDNPLMYTVNWKCAMDVAFRSVNWIFALNMIADFKGFDDLFTEKTVCSLWQHGFFIWNNLEKNIPYSNNHYTSDLVGLLYIGVLFGGSSKGKRWFQYALHEYYEEIRKQVLSSGVHYERSVSYHRMMAELLSYPIYLLHRVKEKVPVDAMDRIKAMYAYVANYTKPNGLAPLIADNDDGRFLPLIRRDFRKHDYLNDANSVENRIVTVGLEPIFCVPSVGNGFYEDAGFAVIRKNNDYLFVCSGGYSGNPRESDKIINTHTHNDLLSFELALNGEDILVDAGAYLYTSSEIDRNLFRATSKHNTLMVDNEEQNDFVASFTLKRNVRIKKLKHLSCDVVEGEYTTLKNGLNHKRRFELGKNRLTITDTLNKTGKNHKATLFLHFAKGIIPALNDSVIELNNGIVITFNYEPLRLELLNDFVSPSYGVLVESKTAKITFVFNDSIIIETTIN